MRNLAPALQESKGERVTFLDWRRPLGAGRDAPAGAGGGLRVGRVVDVARRGRVAEDAGLGVAGAVALGAGRRDRRAGGRALERRAVDLGVERSDARPPGLVVSTRSLYQSQPVSALTMKSGAHVVASTGRTQRSTPSKAQPSGTFV